MEQCALLLITGQIIINLGTVGAIKKGLSGLIPISRLLQRDMDVRELGLSLGVTPFDDNSHEIIIAETRYSCGSGDSFVTGVPELLSDVVDMEGFAIAKVCQREDINFMCWKFISDTADDKAGDHWKENVAKVADVFTSQILDKF